jgi:hypothetical protein
MTEAAHQAVVKPWYRRLSHWVMHRFDLAGGHVESMNLPDDRYIVWFQCDGCDLRTGQHIVNWSDVDPNLEWV